MGQMWIVRGWKISLFLVTGFFLGRTAVDHAQDIQALEFQPNSSLFFMGAILLILLSEWVAGLLWWRVLDFLGQSVPLSWAVSTFFKTTLAKYLPGNVWHLVGRVNASRQFGLALERVGLSVIIEPLFMVTGGLIISLIYLKAIALQIAALLGVLILLHPWGVGKLASFLAYVKQLTHKKEAISQPTWEPIKRYPWPEMLIGALFMLLRGGSFCLTMLTLQNIATHYVPELISGFSLAWLLSIVLPAPGGMGVFESSAIQILNGVSSPAILLSSVVLFRFLCITTEVFGVVLVLSVPKIWERLAPTYHSLKAIKMPSANAPSRAES